MNVSVTDVNPGQKKIRVEIPASRVREEFEGKYRDLAKSVKIKGFRPGKVPKSIIQSYYAKAVEHEVSTKFIDETFPEALKETEIKPLTQADVSESNFEDDGSFSYTALVDISPPFELPEYKGLKLYKTPVEVPEEQVEAEIEQIRQGHAQLKAVESDRPIRDADMAVVDFTPMVEGKVFEKGKTQDFMIEIGKGSLHPDFDKHLLGHRRGESFSFELDYPAETPTKEIAGKRVHFEVTVKELKEKELPELNDEFAQSIAGSKFDTLEDLKEEIRKQMREREEQRISHELSNMITDKLVRRARFDVTPRVIEAETGKMADNLRYQFERQGLKFDAARFDSPEFRSSYKPQAEKNVRVRLILDKIAEAENISLSDEDNEEIYREIGSAYGIDAEKVKREYADSSFIEQSRDRKIEDKVLKLIEAEAVYVETPEEARDPEEASEPEGGAEQAEPAKQE